MKNKFPMFGLLLVIVGAVWLLEGLGIVSINLPWIPVMLIIAGIGIIFNRFSSK